MKEIIKRNKFTILLGLILAIIFAIIIILSQNQENNFLLTPAKINETFRVQTKTDNNQNQRIETNNNDTEVTEDSQIVPGGVDEELVTEAPVSKPIDRVDEIVANMEPIEIRFNDQDGFLPKDTTAIQDQRLIWFNNSERIIKIIQVIDKYDNLPETIEIGPGQSYGIQLTEPKNWSYREIEGNFVGTIYIYPKKSN